MLLLHPVACKETAFIMMHTLFQGPTNDLHSFSVSQTAVTWLWYPYHINNCYSNLHSQAKTLCIMRHTDNIITSNYYLEICPWHSWRFLLGNQVHLHFLESKIAAVFLHRLRKLTGPFPPILTHHTKLHLHHNLHQWQNYYS